MEDFVVQLARMGKGLYEPGVIPQKPITVQKIGRNTLCPCGSGKKFKKCCINKT